MASSFAADTRSRTGHPLGSGAPIKVRVSLPSVGFTALDRGEDAVMRTVTQITDAHGVRVEDGVATSGAVVLELSATKRQPINCVVRSLAALLGPQHGTRTAASAHVVVSPLTTATAIFRAHLGRGPQRRVRAIGQAGLVSGPELIGHNGMSPPTYAGHLGRLGEKLGHVISSLRTVDTAMRMRIQLGKCYMRQWPENNECLDLAALAASLASAGDRDEVEFEPGMDTSRPQTALHRQLVTHWPASQRTPSKAQLAQASTMAMHIVTREFVVQAQIFASGGRNFSWGPHVAYRRDSALLGSRHVVVACPERSVDWRLQVLLETGAEELPFDDGELEQGIGLLPGTSASTDMPQVSVSEDFIQRHGVERITFRNTESFGFADASLPDHDYEVQFSLNRSWTGGRMRERAPDVTTVELHRLGWDLLMAKTTMARGLRQWGNSTWAFFPPTTPDKHESGLETMLGCINQVQELVDKATATHGGLSTAVA